MYRPGIHWQSLQSSSRGPGLTSFMSSLKQAEICGVKYMKRNVDGLPNSVNSDCIARHWFLIKFNPKYQSIINGIIM
jgi:hypothetical protein